MGNHFFEIKNISKSFFGIHALTDVSFSLSKGRILGVIGENGAGKSTMMNIIGGVLQPDGGSMTLNDQQYAPQDPSSAMDAKIAFVHQELNLFTNLSIGDNFFISNYPGKGLINAREMKKRTREILESVDLDVSPDTIVEKLSPGQQQLVEIAKCLSTEPDIVIFDEPTTSLTANESKRLFDIIMRLKEQGIAIVYISHILNDIKELTDDVIVLRDGKVTDSGETNDFDIKRMIKSMVGRDISQLYPARISEPKEEVVMRVEGLSEAGIAHDINFELKSGEILGLFGLMGSGRTELLRMIFGVDNYKKGKITAFGKKIKKHLVQDCISKEIGFVTENRKEEGLFLNFSVKENITFVSMPKYTSKPFGFINEAGQKGDIKDVINKLKVKTGPIDKQAVKSLSGGNQQKVVIAKWLLSEPQILFIDEPTRGIDVGAKFEVYSILNKLAAEGKSILMVSSEIEELIGMCDRILVMSKGEIFSEFTTADYDKQAILAAAFRQI